MARPRAAPTPAGSARPTRSAYGSRRDRAVPASRWSSTHQVVLAQASVDVKTNEITVIPELIEVVGVAGAVVTTDAMGTQKDIAWKIREHHGHYVLALKDNHPKLHEDVQWLFSHADELGWEQMPHSDALTEERDHGREEKRECQVLSDLSVLDVQGWRDLASVARVTSTRTVKGVRSTQTRYFITSLPQDAARVMHAVRYHWSIENGLH